MTYNLLRKRHGRGGGNIPVTPGSGTGGGGGGSGGGSTAVSIPLSVERLVTGSGTTLVSNGYLLKPGQLLDTDLSNVRLFVAGVEQQIFIKALHGRHTDGTVRSILIQFNYNLVFATPVVGELRLGEARGTVDIAEVPVNTIPGFAATVGSTNGAVISKYGYPDAVALITDTAHLLACDAFLPTISSADATALGTYFANFETERDSFGDSYWNIYSNLPTLDASSIILSNQYDRCHWHLVEYCRRGESKWYQRGLTYMYLVLRTYIIPNAGKVIHHHAHPKGLELSYWLTGFEDFRTWAHTTADFQYTSYTLNFTTFGDRAQYVGETRPMAQVFDMIMSMHRLGYTDRAWNTIADTALDKVFGLIPVGGTPTYNSTGLYEGAWTCPKALGAGIIGTQNFMDAMLCGVILRYYNWFANAARKIIIEDKLDLYLTYLNTQYRDQASTRYIKEGTVYDPSTGTPSFAGEPTKSFNYVSSSYSAGGPSASVDLNGFYPLIYSWVGWKKSKAAYKAFGDTLYETLQRTPHDGHTGPFLYGGSFTAVKQFNEVNFQSIHHLYYRSAV